MPTVLTSVADGVAEIVLNRPEVSNALDLEVAGALRDALVRVADDPEVAVVLLRGEGRLFCAGGDLGSMAAATDRAAVVRELADGAHDVVRLIEGLGKPLVVAVQGAAAGVGFSLVLGADLVVAAESARFVTAYTSVGLTPDGGMSWLLPRAIGQRRASELILTARPVDAAEALALGIVSRTCPDDELLETARATAAALVHRSAHALGAARRLVRRSWAHGLDEHLELEAATISAAVATEDTGVRIDAFLAR